MLLGWCISLTVLTKKKAHRGILQPIHARIILFSMINFNRQGIVGTQGHQIHIIQQFCTKINKYYLSKEESIKQQQLKKTTNQIPG